MIEETARIVEVHQDFAWAETQRQSACGSCSANKGCGTAVVAKVVGVKRTRIKVLNTLATQVGDEVIIGLEETAIVRGSLAVYAMPLLSMLVMAVLGEMINTRLEFTHTEGLTVFFGLSGLAGGFFWLRRYASSISRDASYQPIILRRVAPSGVIPAVPLIRF